MFTGSKDMVSAPILIFDVISIVSIDFVDVKYIEIDTNIVSFFFFIQYL
jgi:hypothetical protein